MNQPRDQIDIDKLMSNGNWVRNLARRLLYDENMVDDVMQEVWITALQRPPSKPQALQAWLKTVVRSLALRANRSKKRRDHHEGNIPKKPNVGPTDTILANLEVRQKLIEGILELDDPYRSVVYLHFFEELKLTEIAKQLSVPDSTVRTQLSRGIDKLRGSLESKFQGKRSWRNSLLLLIAPPDLWDSLSSGSALSSELKPNEAPHSEAAESQFNFPQKTPPSPNSTWEYLAFPLAAAFVLMMGWALFSASKLDDADESQDKGSPSTVQTLEHSLRHPNPNGSIETTTTAPAELKSPLPIEQENRRWVKVLRRSDLSPVEGAQVYFRKKTQYEAIEAGQTDADGRLELLAIDLDRSDLFILKDGFLEHRQKAKLRNSSALSEIADLEILLDPAVENEVQLVSQQGDPLANIAVTFKAVLRGLSPPEATTLMTNAQGQIKFEQSFVDTLIEIHQPPYASVKKPLTPPKTKIELRIGMERFAQVIDSHGVGVGNCTIKIETESNRTYPSKTTSDPNGEFSLGILEPDEKVTLRVYHPDFPAIKSEGQAPKVGKWILSLNKGTSLKGKILDPEGQPVDSGFVFVMEAHSKNPKPKSETYISNLNTRGVGKSPRAQARLKPLKRVKISKDGSFNFKAIPPTEKTLYLFVFHPKFVNKLYKLDELSSDKTYSIQLERGAKLAGTLNTPSGQPIAGCRLHVGDVWSNSVEGIIGSTVTQKDGSFTIYGIPHREKQALSFISDQSPSEKETDVYRSYLFITSFSPDELYSSNGQLLEESNIPNGFKINAQEGEFESLQLIGFKKSQRIDLQVRLEDSLNRPIRTWTPSLILDQNHQLHSGLLGKSTQSAKFFSDTSLTIDSKNLSGSILLRPKGYKWIFGSIKLNEDSEEIYSQATPLDEHPQEIQFFKRNGKELQSDWIYVGFPEGTEEVQAWVRLGKTNDKGFVDSRVLPSGSYVFAYSEPGLKDQKEDWLPAEKGVSFIHSNIEIYSGASVVQRVELFRSVPDHLEFNN